MNGNRRQWWTDESISAFDERVSCFVDQYNKYTLMGQQIDGSLTITENLADNGGIQSTFRAYKNRIARGTARNFDLPILNKYTYDQIFFIAFSQGHRNTI